MPAGRSRQPRTNTRNCGDPPAHQSLLNRRLDGSASSPAHALQSASTRSRQRDGKPASTVVDNEHQSFCARTGCRAACSPPTATSSITAATRGTASSTSPGSSCPSASGTGPMHDDQRGLVLYRPEQRRGAHLRRVHAVVQLLGAVEGKRAWVHKAVL